MYKKSLVATILFTSFALNTAPAQAATNIEYGASGKSYATITPGCAWNPKTGRPQPFINLFDNGKYILNISLNGVPLTQLSATRPRTPVFLVAGNNIITAAHGVLSVDKYVRDGGTGTCSLL